MKPDEPDKNTHSAPNDDAASERRHEEWLLDEALSETFPASDPIAPASAKSPTPSPR